MAGLSTLVDAYFAALGGGDPGLLPLAADARFTENGQELAIGTGLWATASGAADGRAITVADESGRQLAGWGMVREGGSDALLGVRLGLSGKAIREIETLVVRRAPFGRDTFPDSLFSASPAMASVLAGDARPSQAELAAAAHGYLDGVSFDDADLMPVADDCVRIENGLQTVLNPDGAGFPEPMADSEGLRLGVRAQIRTRAFRYIEEIRDRRILVTDTARGLVLVGCFFDHPGQVRGADFVSPIATPNSMLIFELFKVSGGLIRRIEAIGAAFPYGMRSGWLPARAYDRRNGAQAIFPWLSADSSATAAP